MARVLGVHDVELKPDVDPDEFERAAKDVLATAELPGWRVRVLKGERGARCGRYLLVFEIESVEARDRLYPEEGRENTSEGAAYDEQHPDSAAAWERLTAMMADEDVATDYVEIAG